MKHIYAVANQKGGVGKTTTAVNMMDILSSRGFSVLGMDLDPQCNLSSCCRASDSGASALGVLTGEVETTAAIQHISKNKHIISGSKSLAGADGFITDTGKEYRLREAIEPILDQYDYIIIDTPPALGILTINALTAADKVIITAQADLFSLQGISELGKTISLVQKYCNRDLRVAGALLTRYNPRSSFNTDVRELASELASGLNTVIFTTTIREGIDVKKSQLTHTPLREYAPRAGVTQDYEAFVTELLKKEEA